MENTLTDLEGGNCLLSFPQGSTQSLDWHSEGQTTPSVSLGPGVHSPLEAQEHRESGYGWDRGRF